MSRTTPYIEHHAQIMQLGRELREQLKPELLAANPARARQALASFSGKLSMHLTLEDRLLYPELLHCADPAIREIAERFVEEMVPISHAFKEYAVRWSGAGAIQKEPEAFVTETKAILAAVAYRIQRENEELYPLAEKLSESGAA